jgi:hypothetical protein
MNRSNHKKEHPDRIRDVTSRGWRPGASAAPCMLWLASGLVGAVVALGAHLEAASSGWPTVALGPPVRAEVPVQTVVYVGTSRPATARGPGLALAAYHWRTPDVADLSVYAGPSWDFLGQRLGLELKAGAYTFAAFRPVLNLEVSWDDGPLLLDYFGEVYGNGEHYHWVDARYALGALWAGLVGDLTWDPKTARWTGGLGPEFGVGHGGLELLVAPTWDLDGAFSVRLFLNVELGPRPG